MGMAHTKLLKNSAKASALILAMAGAVALSHQGANSAEGGTAAEIHL